MVTFDEILRVHAGDQAQLRDQLQVRFGFPQAFWHPEDGESCLDAVRGCLEDLGLRADLIPASLVQQTVDQLPQIDSDEDEDLARRHQIGVIVRHVNASLGSRAEAQLRAFGNAEPGWESDEPVWLLVTPGQREQLLAKRIASAPPVVEAEYDPSAE